MYHISLHSVLSTCMKRMDPQSIKDLLTDSIVIPLPCTNTDSPNKRHTLALCWQFFNRIAPCGSTITDKKYSYVSLTELSYFCHIYTRTLLLHVSINWSQQQDSSALPIAYTYTAVSTFQ